MEEDTTRAQPRGPLRAPGPHTLSRAEAAITTPPYRCRNQGAERYTDRPGFPGDHVTWPGLKPRQQVLGPVPSASTPALWKQDQESRLPFLSKPCFPRHFHILAQLISGQSCWGGPHFRDEAVMAQRGQAVCLRTHRRQEEPGPGFLAPAPCNQGAAGIKGTLLVWPGHRFHLFDGNRLPL